MNLSDFKKELARKHIESNGLTDSFISKTTLMQCKDVLPERIHVGIDNEGNRIFLKKRLVVCKRNIMAKQKVQQVLICCIVTVKSRKK